jgi:hypothetical protein
MIMLSVHPRVTDFAVIHAQAIPILPAAAQCQARSTPINGPVVFWMNMTKTLISQNVAVFRRMVSGVLENDRSVK